MKGSFTSILAITDFQFLWGAGTEQDLQTFRSPIAVHKYAASDSHLRERLFSLFSENKVLRTFLNGRTFLRSMFDEKENVGKKGTFKFCSDRNESFASLKQNRARKRVHG